MGFCKFCVLQRGLKGTDVVEGKGDFKTDEELFNHLEEVHGRRVRREGETEEECVERNRKKGIVSDRTLCQCEDCKELRKLAEDLMSGKLEVDENFESVSLMR